MVAHTHTQSRTLCCPSGGSPIITCPQDFSHTARSFLLQAAAEDGGFAGSAGVKESWLQRGSPLGLGNRGEVWGFGVQWLQYDSTCSSSNLVFLCFFFFYSCSFIVCILPVVTWSHASRSRQKLASNMKAHTLSELCRSTDFPLHQQKPSSHWFIFMCLLGCIHNTTTLPLHSFVFFILHLWLVQFLSEQKIF